MDVARAPHGHSVRDDFVVVARERGLEHVVEMRHLLQIEDHLVVSGLG